MIRNIIANAINFSPNGGKVNISIHLTSEQVEISIEDQGIGMTPHEVDMLFNILKDTGAIGNSQEKGSGLGLILSHEFIQKSNGDIKVVSAQDKGSTFTILLPKCATKETQCRKK